MKDCTLTAMSFNIRNSCDKGTEAWEMRIKNLVPLVLAADPDCIGFQEVLPNQYRDLTDALSAYASVGKAREDGVDKGERSAVFFRKSRFNLLDSGDFWLSETPDVPSFGWDAACIRICTYVRLYDKVTDKEFYHFNTHLDHVGQTAMLEGAKMICAAVRDRNAPAFVTGDFNVNEGSPAYNAMIENGMSDSKYNAVIRYSHGTFHGYNPGENLINESPIDYLFYTGGNFSVSEYKVIVNGGKGEYTSDHYPILVKMTQI